MPDRDQWELRGSVRRVEVRSQTAQSERRSVIEFRADGSILSRRDRNLDGSEFALIYTYDDAGRLVSLQSTSSSGEPYLRVHEYDDAGRLARVIGRDPTGSERMVETYSYDPENRRTRKQFIALPQHDGHPNVLAAGEGRSVFKVYYGAPNTASVTTVHDQADRTRELLFHDAEGALLSRVQFVYDESDNLIEESQTSTQPLLPQLENLPAEQRDAIRDVLRGPVARSVHRYDAIGRRIETDRFLFDSLSHERETFTYNEHGDLMSKTSEGDSRTYGFDDAGRLESKPDPQRRSETRFRYEYDERGNWTSKISEYRNGGDREFSVSLTETRILTYFDSI